ncbi:MAG: hypothetical protein HY327_11810 [Chloroflexi bacterium]|nr:hypothetical protein [Chloroflexota bacterium]
MIALRLHGKILQIVASLVWAIDIERFKAIAQIGAASRAILEAEELASQEPHTETVRLLTILSKDAWRTRTPRDWDAAERYARAAADMAEKLDNPPELSVALDALGNVYFARGLLRERVQVALRRLELSRDPHFSDVRERVSILIEIGDTLLTVGEYAQAMTYLTEATSLADEIHAVDQQIGALQHRSYCLFRLDRWDDMLKILDLARDIRTRYSREHIGGECFQIALAASVHTRRGESDLGVAERAEAHSIMTALGGPLERWGRGNLY